MKVKVLELFAGSRSFGKVAELLGMKVLSVDKFIEENMDFVCGIEELTKHQIVDFLEGDPAIIWASPVCTVWSKTSWFSYWDKKAYKNGKFLAKKDFAIESVEMVKKTIEIFSWFPDSIFFMENPEGLLFKHPVINLFNTLNLENFNRHKVTYCQYGGLVRKPTHIWSNSKKWKPRKHCIEGMDCHLPSPKGSQSGVRALKGNYDRSKVPDQLCFEILKLFQDENRDFKISKYVKKDDSVNLFSQHLGA